METLRKYWVQFLVSTLMVATFIILYFCTHSEESQIALVIAGATILISFNQWFYEYRRNKNVQDIEFERNKNEQERENDRFFRELF